MGSGRSNLELTCSAKKPREIKRREKTQLKRLIALGVPGTVAGKLNSKQVRAMLSRPKKVTAQYARVASAKA